MMNNLIYDLRMRSSTTRHFPLPVVMATGVKEQKGIYSILLFCYISISSWNLIGIVWKFLQKVEVLH